jgi:hypothetical protein
MPTMQMAKLIGVAIRAARDTSPTRLGWFEIALIALLRPSFANLSDVLEVCLGL